MPKQTELNSTAEHLLNTAERLLAEKGLGAVSTREIAREAGQKNHSALNYHFGSMDGLIEAILDHRMVPLNQRRHQLLDTLIAEGREGELRSLVEVLIEPLVSELLLPPKESYYLDLLAQILTKGEWLTLFSAHPHRSSSVLKTGDLMALLMREVCPEELALERLRLMGSHILTTVTQWNVMRRRGELVIDEPGLQWRVKNLVDYLVGALLVESSD